MFDIVGVPKIQNDETTKVREFIKRLDLRDTLQQCTK